MIRRESVFSRLKRLADSIATLRGPTHESCTTLATLVLRQEPSIDTILLARDVTPLRSILVRIVQCTFLGGIRMCNFVSLGIAALTICMCLVPPAYAADLPPKIERAINQDLVPAYLDGSSAAVLNHASRLARRLSNKHLDAVNESLESNGVPSLGKLMIDARLALLRSKFKGRLPAPTRHELNAMVPVFKREVENLITEINESAFMKDKSISPDFKALEEAIWQAHVVSNQLENAQGMVNQGLRLVPRQPKRTDKDVANEAAQLASRIREVDAELKRLKQLVAERTIELRLNRIDFALDTLQGNSGMIERIKSAWIMELDGPILKQFFEDKKAGQKFLGDRLNEETLGSETAAKVAKGTELAGADLMRKSRLFYTGLHWWFRGRYGKGPEGYGFLKRESAYNNPQEMFGLYMPIERPKPTSPANYTYQIPEVDRRHHYIWMFEYRRLFTRGFDRQFEDRKTTVDPQKRTQLSRFY